MKFATYRNGTRDGQLMVVSRDLSKAVAVPALAETLQEVLDDWDGIAPELEKVYAALNSGELDDAEAFDESLCESPLPRAYPWAATELLDRSVDVSRRS